MKPAMNGREEAFQKLEMGLAVRPSVRTQTAWSLQLFHFNFTELIFLKCHLGAGKAMTAKTIE